MSKKVLNIEGIQNELEGASLYFTRPTPPPPAPAITTPELEKPVVEPEINSPTMENTPIRQSKKLTKKKAQTIVSKPAIMHASIDASTLAHSQDDLIEAIRKTVKQVGKDTVFIRLTPDEKADLASVVFTFNELYRGNNRKISENAVGRIALNLLLIDYRENGELSVLARVLAALNA